VTVFYKVNGNETAFLDGDKDIRCNHLLSATFDAPNKCWSFTHDTGLEEGEEDFALRDEDIGYNELAKWLEAVHRGVG